MRSKIKSVKKLVVYIAKDYNLKYKWDHDRKLGLINVRFYLPDRRYRHQYTLVVLKADKISSGRYTIPMVEYNIVRHLNSWLHKIYEHNYKKMSEAN